MKIFMKRLRPAVVSLIIFTILCGIIYPGVITGVAQALFSSKANGSIITVKLKDGTVRKYGSKLIAQEFKKSKYLIGRPMGTSNLSAVGDKQKKLVEDRIKWWHELDPTNKRDIPMDLVTSSGSGVDPNISPEAGIYQVARIARVRNISEDKVRGIIKKYTSKRLFGLWGNPGVNVLEVNLALDGAI